MEELLIYPQDQLPPDLKCQVLSFLRIVFWDGFTGENRLRDWITHPRHHPLHFLLVEQGLVISGCEVVWKDLEHAGVSYKTYGLTGVFTYPSFRGQGYGTRVIGAATDYIAASDADVGMFHCAPGLKGFYAACGWIPMEGAKTYVGARAKPVLSQELMMMRFFSEKGAASRKAFETLPVYFDEDDTW